MSKDTRIINACKRGYENRDKFIALANQVIKKDVLPYDENKHLTKEAIDGIATVMSIDMSTGAEFKKVQYIVTGIAIGVVVTVTVISTNKLIKKYKK